MRSISVLLCLAVGCGGGSGVVGGNAPDGSAPGHHPDGGGGAPDAATTPPAPDASTTSAPDAGTSSACNSMLTSPMTAAFEPQPWAPWHRCGTYGTGSARRIEIAANGASAVVVTEAGDAFVLAMPSLQPIGVFRHGTGPITAAALSPDGALVATANDPRGEVLVWNVESGALLHTFFRSAAWPSLYGLDGLAFSSDGSRLAAISYYGIDAWLLATETSLPISSHPDLGGMRVAYAAGDSRLVISRFLYWGNGPYSGWGNVDIVDADTGNNAVRLPYEFHISLAFVAVSDSGAHVAVASDTGTVALFDAATGAALPIAPMTGMPLALSDEAGAVALREPDAISVRAVSDGAQRARIAAAGAGPFAVTRTLVTALVGASSPDVVTAVAVADGRHSGLACGTGDGAAVTDVAVSHDGTTLVSNGTQAWDVLSGNARDDVPSDLVHASNVSPDGTLVAEPATEPTFVIKETSDGTVNRTLGPHVTRVTDLEWSQDGAYIVSSAERDPQDRWVNPPLVKIWSTRVGDDEPVPLQGDDRAAALFHPSLDQLFVPTGATTVRWCAN